MNLNVMNLNQEGSLTENEREEILKKLSFAKSMMDSNLFDYQSEQGKRNIEETLLNSMVPDNRKKINSATAKHMAISNCYETIKSLICCSLDIFKCEYNLPLTIYERKDLFSELKQMLYKEGYNTNEKEIDTQLNTIKLEITW